MTTLNNLKGQKLGIPVTLPPFDPENDVWDAPDYDRPECWNSRFRK